MLLTWTAAGPAQETSGSAAGKTAADNPNTQSTKTTAETKTEVSSKDTGTTFKLRVNVVQVKVVVRDAKGNLVKGLKREDFLLYDQGKLQMISTFGVETPETRRKRAEEAAKTQAGEEAAPANEEKTELPERFVALVFDDIHLRMQDALVVRTSAKVLVDSMTPTDRMAIYSTSGQVTQEFTSDKEALVEKLKAISPRPLMQKATVSQCPDVTYAMADQAINKSDPQVVPVVTEEVLHCQFGGNTQMVSAAAGVAQMALQQALTAGDTDNEYTYLRLDDALKRLTGKPGERVLVLVSPGFILSSLFVEEMGILDRANRSGIVINTVDARGLYVPEPLGDISQRTVDMTPGMAALKSSFRLQEQAENDYVLMDFASGTGGTFFHNSNDLKEGLRLAGAAPEVSYVLGFSPQNQKMDGRYHLLKVAMAEKQKYDIQARRDYYPCNNFSTWPSDAPIFAMACCC
jgi:VWFA-related protein